MSDREWEEKRNLYIKIHDAVVRDNEKLYAENVRLKEAVAAEREACANLLLSADLSGLRNDLMLQNWTANLLANFAAAIRARGQS